MLEASARGKTSLHRWASLRSELLWVQDGSVLKPTEHQEADHSTGYWLWLIRKGSVEVRAGKGILRAAAGQWLISPQCKITQDFTQNSDILSLHFHCQWPTGENIFTGTEGYVLESSEYPALTETALSLAQLIGWHFPGVRTDFPFQSAEYAVFLTFHKTFVQLLIDFSNIFFGRGRRPARTGELNERLVEALECLNESPLDEAFPAGALRKRTGLGRAYLDRMFLKEFHLTTRGHWDKQRQDCAIRSLHNSALSIKEIGYKVGFKQTANFTKWFTKRTGMTPTAYRAKGPVQWLM